MSNTLTQAHSGTDAWTPCRLNGPTALYLTSALLVFALGTPHAKAEIATCMLSASDDPNATTTLSLLQADVAAAVGAVSDNLFVVVYSVDQENNGQPNFAGPVVCAKGLSDFPVGAPLPDPNFPPNSLLGPVDILDSSEALLLRYRPPGGGDDRTRFCHTADDEARCVDLP